MFFSRQLLLQNHHHHHYCINNINISSSNNILSARQQHCNRQSKTTHVICYCRNNKLHSTILQPKPEGVRITLQEFVLLCYKCVLCFTSNIEYLLMNYKKLMSAICITKIVVRLTRVILLSINMPRCKLQILQQIAQKVS